LTEKAIISVYDDVITEIAEAESGNYLVTIKNKTPKTLYSALIKRTKDRDNIKVKMRKDQIFIVKS